MKSNLFVNSISLGLHTGGIQIRGIYFLIAEGKLHKGLLTSNIGVYLPFVLPRRLKQ